MIDIGVHLVDLIRWFQGDFQEVFAVASTYYWDLDHFEDGHQLDDNAFFLDAHRGRADCTSSCELDAVAKPLLI